MGTQTDSLQITQIITGLTVGGAQQLLLGLSQELMALGHKVRVIGLRPGGLADEFRQQGIPVEELCLKGMLGLPTLFRLTALLKRQRPDIVHTHLGRADNFGRLAARLARVPVIVTTVHNVDAWKANILFRRIDAWTSRYANQIVACSGRVGEHLRELGLVPNEKITVIRNGICLRDWSDRPEPAAVLRLRGELGLRPNDFVIGVIGRLEKQKGHRHLFEALAILKEDVADWRLLVVGEGALRQALEELAERLGLSSQVSFAGVRRDMRMIYAASDVVVLPSLWEGLPLVLLEAMAARRPVVGTRVGGVPEVLRHKETGFLVPPGDSAALCAAIKRCYLERERAEAMAEAAYQWVGSNCSIETNARQLLTVYNKLIHKLAV